jgi:hypothetical protein
MLNAVLSGKARSVLHSDGSLEAVSTILLKYEDPRTATIFERISYMPGPLAWELIRRSSGGVLQEYRFAELIEIQFWPNWFMTAADRSHSQPDVFLRWEVGDPAVQIDMILEAKMPNGVQGSWQWRDQLEAYRDHVREGEYSSAESIAQRLVYICIDGLGRKPADAVIRMTSTLQIPAGLPPVTFAGCTWQSIADSLGEMVEANDLSLMPAALADDLVRSFAFLGHAHLSMPDAVLAMDYPNQATESMKTILAWSIK